MASANELHNGQRGPGWVLGSILKHQLVNCIRWHTLEHPYPQNKPHILNGTNFLISLLTGTLFQWPFNPQIIAKQCLLPFCHQLQLPSLQHHLGWAALQQNLTPKDSRSNRNLLLCSMQLIRKHIGHFPNFYIMLSKCRTQMDHKVIEVRECCRQCCGPHEY